MISNQKIGGSIRPRPSGDNIKYFDIVLELGTDKNTGKRKRLYFKADTADRTVAENMLTLKKAEYLSGDMVEPSKQTVGDFLDEYLRDFVQVQSSPATLRDYKGVIDRYLKPMFGSIKLQELRTSRIQQVYNQWRIKSNASDKPLKATTVQHINRIFKAALSVACDLGYIKNNPTRKVRIGKDNESTHLEVYTTQEIWDLIDAVKGTDMALPVALLFDCVMRRGELLGLRFKDVDFENNTVYIRHSWVESEDSKKPVLKDCKTDGSARKMIVSKETMRLLKRQELYCKTICLREGKRFSGEQHVVCKNDGTPFLPKSFTAKWEHTLKKYGLRHIKLHGTRHSAISWLLSKGVPLHLVQERAGHQDPKITLSVYSHVAKDDANVAAEVLGNELFTRENSQLQNRAN